MKTLRPPLKFSNHKAYAWPHRYNIAPSQPVLALVGDPEPRLDVMEWGYVPSWAKPEKNMKPAQRIALLKKNIAESASKTAAIIRINAAKLRQSVWPDRRVAEKARKERKDKESRAKAQPAVVD